MTGKRTKAKPANMKRFALSLLCIMFGLFAFAQQRATLKISASVIHKDATPTYRATVTLGSGYSSLPSEVMNLDLLKKRYRAELENSGFNFEALHENPNGFGYETLAQKKEGSIYTYTTTSLETMRRFMQIRPLGVESIYVVSIIEIDAGETEALAKQALTQAKEKAKGIAFGMNRALGKIVHVEDIANRWGNTIETSVYYDRPANECRYTLDVTFELQ